MSDPDPDPTDGEEAVGGNEEDAGRVERTFTCTHCGYPATHEATELQVEVRSVCRNCGDWTVQTADQSVILDAAGDVAESLAGPVLTERQALAYLLRELLDVDRQTAAEEMDGTPSNVDNLHRRGVEKVEDARRVVDEVDRLRETGE